MTALKEGRQDVEVERVTLRSTEGEPVEAVHARPLGMPRLGIVLHPDIMGIRPLFDDMCRRLATHGAAVCAPEPFARIDDRDALEATDRMALVGQLQDSVQLGDLERAADYLVVEDGVDTVAVLGFCMGGMYALKAAAAGRFDRAVAFYGMIRVPPGWQSSDLREPLETAADVCPTLAIFGGADAFTPPEDIEALRSVWANRSDCDVVVYPDADHGFVHDPDRPAHRPDDAADAWNRVLTFLGLRTNEA